ncbi:hypothetical protein [Williamsia sterculiae]|uniref:hypothetical protein n=1 Tax=Williamsia sterculiae TaxID=1344003 RepID=UPI000970ED9F|nr:hypothetical protein [Williamsia sterculiae]
MTRSAVPHILDAVLAACGLTVLVCSFLTWGSSDQGVHPSVSGTGSISVPGAAADDVAFLERYTNHPGSFTVLTGALIMVAAAMVWLGGRRIGRVHIATAWSLFAVAVGMLCSVVTMAVTIWCMVDPGGALFDTQVAEAMNSSVDLAVGPGLVVALAGAILALVTAAGLGAGLIIDRITARAAQPR